MRLLWHIDDDTCLLPTSNIAFVGMQMLVCLLCAHLAMHAHPLPASVQAPSHIKREVAPQSGLCISKLLPLEPAPGMDPATASTQQVGLVICVIQEPGEILVC